MGGQGDKGARWSPAFQVGEETPLQLARFPCQGVLGTSRSVSPWSHKNIQGLTFSLCFDCAPLMWPIYLIDFQIHHSVLSGVAVPATPTDIYIYGNLLSRNILLHLKPSSLLGDSLDCLWLCTEYKGAAGELLGQSVNLAGTRNEVRKSHSHLSHLSFIVLIVLRTGEAGVPPFCY